MFYDLRSWNFSIIYYNGYVVFIDEELCKQTTTITSRPLDVLGHDCILYFCILLFNIFNLLWTAPEEEEAADRRMEVHQ